MICKHKLNSQLEILNEDPKYGVTILLRRVQLNFPYLTEPYKNSGKLSLEVLLLEKDAFSKKNMAILKRIAEFSLNKEVELKGKKYTASEKKACAAAFMNTKLVKGKNKSGQFFKLGSAYKDKNSGKVKEELKDAVKVIAKAPIKEGSDQPVVKIAFSDSNGLEIDRANIASEFYSGAIVNVRLQIVPVVYQGSIYLSSYIRGVQKLLDHEPLSTGATGFEPDTSMEGVEFNPEETSANII